MLLKTWVCWIAPCMLQDSLVQRGKLSDILLFKFSDTLSHWAWIFCGPYNGTALTQTKLRFAGIKLVKSVSRSAKAFYSLLINKSLILD